MERALDIMESLEWLFEKQSARAKHEAIKAIMNAKQNLRTPVRELFLKLISYHGALIDESTQLDKILEIFSSAFLKELKELKDNKKYSKYDLLVLGFLFTEHHESV